MKQLFILTISTILILLSLLIYSGIYIDLSRDELEKKYAKPPSKFLNLPDGTAPVNPKAGKSIVRTLKLSSKKGTSFSKLNNDPFAPCKSTKIGRFEDPSSR